MNILTHCVKALDDTFYDLTIVHFLIGCKSNPIRSGFPIHEFPKLVRNIFISPESSFDTNSISYIESLEKFKIRQILYLIDPEYARSGPEIAHAAIKELSKEGDIVSKKIISSLYMFTYPTETRKEEMNILINIFNNNPKYIINIQDTTGIDMCKEYVSGSKIHRLPADCALNTSETYACPIITYAENFRWINIQQDHYRMNDFFESEYVLNYLKYTAEHIFCKYEAVALIRLWNLHDINEDIFTVVGEKIKLSTITNKNYSKYYKIVIAPYIGYRVSGNFVEHYILKFIENWFLKYMYISEIEETKTFKDMIISECKIRTDILNETFFTSKDLSNIIARLR
jgi:hypothetical protein